MGALPHLKNFWNAGTRPPRSFRSASHPPSVTNLASEKSFLFHLYPISGQLILQKTLLETFAFTLPPTGAMAKPIFSSHWTSSLNSSHKTLLWFYLKFAVSSCDSDFFHVTGVPTTGPHEIPIQILSQFWKYWFDFFLPFFAKQTNWFIRIKKKFRKTLKDSKTLLWLSSISVLFVGGQRCSLSGTTRVPGSISKGFE